MAAAPPSIRPHTVPATRRRFSLWRYPAAAIVIGIVAQFVTREIDEALAGKDIPDFLDRGSADDVRAVLATIAGASITTLALVLSITMVVLTMAATQFGPRLIRGFLGTRSTKVTIALFTGLFVYSLLVLDSITTGAEGPELIPEIGTTVTLLVTFAAVMSLIWYVHDVAQSIQLNQVVSVIADDLANAIIATRDDRESAAPGRDLLDVEAEWAAMADQVINRGLPVTTARSGYVQQFDFQPLTEVAAGHGVVIYLQYRAGDFVMSGDTVALVDRGAGRRDLVDGVAVVEAPIEADVLRGLEQHVDLGPHRTLDQDLEFTIDKLVEIALRALSPAINDTFTGLTCLDWLGASLRSLSTIPVERSIHCDSSGRIRVVERSRHFSGLITSAYAKIRQASADNPAITIRMLESIQKVAEVVTTDEGRAALAEEADMVLASALATGYVAKDESVLRERYLRVCATLGHEPT